MTGLTYDQQVTADRIAKRYGMAEDDAALCVLHCAGDPERILRRLAPPREDSLESLYAMRSVTGRVG